MILPQDQRRSSKERAGEGRGNQLRFDREANNQRNDDSWRHRSSDQEESSNIMSNGLNLLHPRKDVAEMVIVFCVSLILPEDLMCVIKSILKFPHLSQDIRVYIKAIFLGNNSCLNKNPRHNFLVQV